MPVSSDSVLVLNHRSCGGFKGTEDRMDSCYICSAVLSLHYLDRKMAILVSEGV